MAVSFPSRPHGSGYGLLAFTPIVTLFHISRIILRHHKAYCIALVHLKKPNLVVGVKNILDTLVHEQRRVVSCPYCRMEVLSLCVIQWMWQPGILSTYQLCIIQCHTIHSNKRAQMVGQSEHCPVLGWSKLKLKCGDVRINSEHSRWLQLATMSWHGLHCRLLFASLIEMQHP